RYDDLQIAISSLSPVKKTTDFVFSGESNVKDGYELRLLFDQKKRNISRHQSSSFPLTSVSTPLDVETSYRRITAAFREEQRRPATQVL
ncbi:uncharacterized, partial [Tachysurus ichikawai]